MPVATEKSAGAATIRPFRVDIPEDELADRLLGDGVRLAQVRGWMPCRGS